VEFVCSVRQQKMNPKNDEVVEKKMKHQKNLKNHSFYQSIHNSPIIFILCSANYNNNSVHTVAYCSFDSVDYYLANRLYVISRLVM
jgi:hypothetical protein